VKRQFNLEKLFLFLDSQSIVLSNHQQDQFNRYEELLKVWSKKQNLVSKRDISHLIEHHFLPSALFSYYLPETFTGKLLDIGSGAGFPGVILKILRPKVSLTLLDSSYKKVLFLEEVCERLALDCQIICQRSEKHDLQTSEKYPILVSRGVARLEILWNISGHLIKPGGFLYALKGGNFQQEIDELSDKTIKVKVIAPEAEWLKTTNYLDNKYMIILEK
jgi:16S rRNA (guanine527-N7)-methyltransferase